MQVRDQAGAALEAGWELPRHPERGLHQVQEEPKEGLEAGRQEVVLHTHQGIRTSTANTSVYYVSS